MKSILITILLTIALTACGEVTHSANSNDIHSNKQTQTDKPADNALKFINAYVDYANTMNTTDDILNWVDTCNICTARFRLSLKQILEDAYKQDPELELGFDPIFDAQDYPNKGFELSSVDNNTNYVMVKGIDWPEFQLTIKMVNENENWLIDGCGIVNMTEK